MRKISIWAKHHKWEARFSITGIHITLNVLAIICGILFSRLNVSLPSLFLGIAILTVFAAAMAYPSKTNNPLPRFSFYKKQKRCDFILVAATFCMVTYIGNHLENPLDHYPVINATKNISTTLPADSVKKNYKSIIAFNTSMKDENGKMLKWKERKKLLKEQIGGIKKTGELSDGGKVALIVLSVLVALGLLYLVAALSCNLSCSGSDAAAILVLVLGAGLIAFLMVRIIRRIGNPRKPKPAPAPAE